MDMEQRTNRLPSNDYSNGERLTNGFYLNRPHLRAVLDAKAALKAKGYSEEWMEAQVKFLPKLMVKTVHP